MVRAAPAVEGTERNEEERVTPCSNQMSLATCSGDIAEVLGSARGQFTHGSTSIVTATCVCKQDTCQIAWSEHAGRGITAPFTWTVGITKARRAEMQPDFNAMVRTAPALAGTKRK